MKKHLLFVGIMCAVTVTPAMAVTKCVNLSSTSTTCAGNLSSSTGADWSATCTTNGQSVDIKGVAACTAATTGRPPVTGTAKTTLSANLASGTVDCYCKMVSPAVSRWIFAIRQENCGSTCAAMCANVLSYSDRAMAKTMFSSLSD